MPDSVTIWDKIAIHWAISATLSGATTNPEQDDDDDYFSYGPRACAEVAPLRFRINALSIAQSVVSIIVAVGCVAVLMVILGRQKDTRSLAPRVLAGVFTSNAIFAAAQAVPQNLFCSTRAGRGMGSL